MQKEETANAHDNPAMAKEVFIHKHNNEIGHIDIDVTVNGVSIIVFNNCNSIIITGKDKKIKFDFPLSSHVLATKKSEHTHENTPDGKPNLPEDKTETDHTRKGAPDSKPNLNEDKTETEHLHGITDEAIDLSIDGIQILLCDCCTILKIKSADTDLNFPLKEFQKSNVTLRIEGDYYVREYFVKMLKHVTNETDQQLFINNIQVDFEYKPALKAFNTHLFFRSYTNVIDILADYLKANPDLGEFKHH